MQRGGEKGDRLPPTNHKLTPPRPSTPALLPRLSWYALLAAVVPPMAGGFHTDVTYVYVGNSRRRRMEFSEKQRLLGDNATPVQVYYQRLYQRQLEIGVVTLTAGGSHAEVTHVYVVNSPVGAWNFQRNNACLGIKERQCRFTTNA